MEEKNGDGLDLVFESIRKKNQGEYACKATIKGEEVEKKFTLSVFSECCENIRSVSILLPILTLILFLYRADQLCRHGRSAVRDGRPGLHRHVSRRRGSGRLNYVESQRPIPSTV